MLRPTLVMTVGSLRGRRALVLQYPVVPTKLEYEPCIVEQTSTSAGSNASQYAVWLAQCVVAAGCWHCCISRRWARWGKHTKQLEDSKTKMPKFKINQVQEL